MKVLFLAPQPCYIDRGTPIAVDLTLATLSDAGYEIDLLTFAGGEDRNYPGVRTFRVGRWFSRKPTRAGLSGKKLWLDMLMLVQAIRLALSNRYTLVHAVEESSFIALILHGLFRIPFVSDMDSRLTTQLTDRFRWLKPFDKLLWKIESLPTRFASGVVAMCDSLKHEVLKVRAGNVFVVKDVSLLDYYGNSELSLPSELADIRGKHQHLLMYIGNLESYQGINLMLSAFALLRNHTEKSYTEQRATETKAGTALVIVGGDNERISHYRSQARALGIEHQCYFLGPQPVGMLHDLMQQADVMLSPRTQGTNTPLKLYSYLDSGVPVLATNLQTHTQVVDEGQAMLCEPNPEAMANAMGTLLDSKQIAEQIATNAKALVEEHHSLEVFRREMLAVYQQVTETRALPDSSEIA